MMLFIKFKNNLLTDVLVKQKNIPCLIQVSDKFEILFPVIAPNTTGIVIEWDRKLLEERAIARAGGTYTHQEPGLITLSKVSENKYKVNALYIFYNDFGWCPIIEKCEYAKPHQFWDSDDEDPDYVPTYEVIK